MEDAKQLLYQDCKVTSSPTPTLKQNKTRKTQQTFNKRYSQMARKTVFPFPVHLYGLTGSVGIWECWRNEIRLEPRDCWAIADVLSHLQAPMWPASPRKSSQTKESREVGHGQRTELCPCVLYTYLYTSHFLNDSTCFSFFFSKWSSSIGYKLMKSSSGMRKAGVTSFIAASPTFNLFGH